MMNNRLVFPLIITCIGLASLLLGSSGGVGTFQREDRTGSPLSLNTTCGTCHYGGNQASSLELTLLKDSVPVREYLPNSDYVVKISIKSELPARAYGLQMVALRDENNLQGGTFYNLPDSLRAVQLWNRTYIEQQRPVAKNTFYVPWRSPEENVGKIKFYASALAANGNGQTSGDAAMRLNPALEINYSSVTGLKPVFGNKKIRVYGFPPERILVTEGFDDGTYRLMVSDLSGRVILNQYIFIQNNQALLPSQAFLSGRHVANLSDGKNFYAVVF